MVLNWHFSLVLLRYFSGILNELKWFHVSFYYYFRINVKGNQESVSTIIFSELFDFFLNVFGFSVCRRFCVKGRGEGCAMYLFHRKKCETQVLLFTSQQQRLSYTRNVIYACGIFRKKILLPKPVLWLWLLPSHAYNIITCYIIYYYSRLYNNVQLPCYDKHFQLHFHIRHITKSLSICVSFLPSVDDDVTNFEKEKTPHREEGRRQNQRYFSAVYIWREGNRKNFTCFLCGFCIKTI